MKKIILSLLILLPLAATVQAQTPEVIELLKTIDGVYKIDDNRDVYVQEVIELDTSLSKDQLYFMLKEYLATAYRNANAVTQIDSKEQGLIVCKGLYTDIYCREIPVGSAGKYTATHILKIDIKDGRIRVTITVTNINEYYSDSGRSTDKKMTGYYPIDQGPRDIMEKKMKAREGFVFYKVVNLMQNNIKDIKAKLSNPQTKTKDEW